MLLLEVSPAESVRSLKGAIEAKKGIPSCLCDLRWNGKNLNNDERLECVMEDLATVEVLLKVFGGFGQGG